MKHRVEKQFLEQLRLKKLVENGDRVVLAVSGGADSMALLELFTAVQPILHCKLVVAHCNFQLRGSESDGDERFVHAEAAKRNIPCVVERFDTLHYAATWKTSIEETARILRYRFFEQLMRTEQCQRVATAHHVNDNAETILFNLVRGVSLPALRGIRAKHGHLIRPLLLLHKADIATYLHDKQIAWREDSSNATTEYDRNFIRHRLIPLIEERFPNKLLPSLQRLAEQAGELEEFLELHIEQLCEQHSGIVLHEGKMNVKALKKLTVFEQKELFKRALHELELSVDAQTLTKLTNLLNTQSGRMVMIEGNVQVAWKGNELCFEQKKT